MISIFKFFYGTVKTKFTVHWNPELEQDLNFYHGIDAEAELTRIMSEEISRRVDEEIIRTITRRINGGMRA
jgi:hypothetical protein